MQTRRNTIALVAGVALAGCASSGGGGGSGGGTPTDRPDSDGDGVPDAEDDFPDDSRRSVLLGEDSETVELNEDYYQAFEFDPSQPAVLDYEAEVRGDVRIDLILTDETNFGYFEDGSEWEYYAEGSDFDTLSAEESMNLGSDRTYYLIVDNTSEGGAEPPTNFDNDRVTVDVEYQLYR